ncbi:MAG: ferrochelatase [Parcubacteria group bacterium Gr01-1014_56]|nr:MAG: ferrochelatase [Parcubacteria group bacterium Gr01-1014_56]
MTYGSATTAEHVTEYFEHIYKGRASRALIQDFENRYRLVGHSPLVEITESQASHLQELLGDAYVVRAGMRHSAPFIEDAVAECKAAGATSLIGVILSPQFSSFIMEGYRTAFIEAAAKHGLEEGDVVAEPWGTEPHFVELLAERTREALEKLNKKYGVSVPIIFTTHSLPKRVVEKDPSYLNQLEATIDAVRKRLDPGLLWYAGYQSAGHTPEEWLKPDLVDILADLHKQKTSAVLIVPIQFLADHLEVLYDLDIAAKKQCEEHGIAYHRIELPNTDPQFIEALASIVKKSEMQ